MSVALPAATSILAFLFGIALFDQWRTRHRAYQLVWAIGMIFFGVASGCEAMAAASGWNEPLYRAWYLTGAVWTAGWLGLGTAFLLGRTRFGYTFAVCLFLAGLFTFLTEAKYAVRRARAPARSCTSSVQASWPWRSAIETCFQNDRWPYMAAVAVVGATVLSIVLMLTTTLPPPGYQVDPATTCRSATCSRRSLRLLTPFLNITGAFALILGAIFSTYVFMPKNRVLAYSLDPNQPGDQFLFNLLIAPVAILVNFMASLPGGGPGHAPAARSTRRARRRADRDRSVHPLAHRQPEPLRVDRVLRVRQVPRAWSSCSRGSSSRSRSSRRSGSRSPGSGSAARAPNESKARPTDRASTWDAP